MEVLWGNAITALLLVIGVLVNAEEAKALLQSVEYKWFNPVTGKGRAEGCLHSEDGR